VNESFLNESDKRRKKKKNTAAATIKRRRVIAQRRSGEMQGKIQVEKITKKLQHRVFPCGPPP
jgi:hypothetical protein